MTTVERLRELLHYDPDTGVFWRLVATTNRVAVGDEAGTFDAYGYRQIKIDRKFYKAHRLAWLYVYGVWPAVEIDHINGARFDNRLTNLREVTHAENMKNQKKHIDNITGFKGVFRHRNGFQAMIMAGGKRICLGTFSEPSHAAAAYRIAAAALHGDFARSE